LQCVLHHQSTINSASTLQRLPHRCIW
jgi:hypothetical protein